MGSTMSLNTKPLAVFYHVAQMGEWQAVDAEIMTALRTSGVLDAAAVFVRNECRDVGLFEFPTIEMIRSFASDHPDYHLLYLHTKGVTHTRKSIADWRACMLYWMVERWRECVAKLDAGFRAVGVNVVELPIRHFQGNFWWANTLHLRTLPPVESIEFKPSVANQSARHKAEFWILSQATRFYQPYHHRLNPYVTENPRAAYAGRKF